MSDPSESVDNVVRSDEITARELAVGGPLTIIAQLSVTLLRQARVIRWAIASLTVSVLLTIVLGVAVYYIGRNANNAHISCVANNAFYKRDQALWSYYLRVRPIRSGETPADTKLREAFTVEFDRYLAKTFASVRCP